MNSLKVDFCLQQPAVLPFTLLQGVLDNHSLAWSFMTNAHRLPEKEKSSYNRMQFSGGFRLFWIPGFISLRW